MTADDLRLDVRLVERMLASGRLSPEEYQKYLDALPDLSSRVVVVNPGSETPGVEADPEASPPKKHSKKQ